MNVLTSTPPDADALEPLKRDAELQWVAMETTDIIQLSFGKLNESGKKKVHLMNEQKCF